jgi:hypothetical protein
MELSSTLQLVPGDLVGWRIPHYGERDGLGVVLRAEKIYQSLPFNRTENVIVLEVLWQKSQRKQAHQMWCFAGEKTSKRDIALSLWKYVPQDG